MGVCMMNSNPLFSIVIPTFNRPNELYRSLNSISLQTIKDIEVIIVDDGSNNKIDKELLKRFKFKIKYIECEKNLGAASARNKGINVATGKYISFLDDDDEFYEDFLENTMDILEENPNISLTWCAVDYINDNTKCSFHPENNNEFFKNEIEVFQKLLSVGIGHGVTIRSSNITNKTLLFDENFKLVEDTDFFLKILSEGRMPYYISHKASVKVHNHNKLRMTSSIFNKLRAEESKILLNKHGKFFNKYPLLKKQLENHITYLEKSVSNVH